MCLWLRSMSFVTQVGSGATVLSRRPLNIILRLRSISSFAIHVQRCLTAEQQIPHANSFSRPFTPTVVRKLASVLKSNQSYQSHETVPPTESTARPNEPLACKLHLRIQQRLEPVVRPSKPVCKIAGCQIGTEPDYLAATSSTAEQCLSA